jgi:WD40 repeat protein
MSNQINKYTIGGNVPADNKMYVVRQADQDFYNGLIKGEFCYVLNARQMGKSSLRVRVAQRLEVEGVACVNIDVTGIGSQNTTREQWYAGIIHIIATDLDLVDFDLDVWWQQHGLLSPVQHLSEFFDKILVERLEKIVIFVDESDAIQQFGQDFFALIRACYNRRADNPAYQRLTFAILGVASPGDLIADRKLTPFNIGVAIELTGFALDEAMVLAAGLGKNQPENLLRIVLEWTGGQPFLTQKLCELISKSEVPIPEGQEEAWIEQLIQTKMVDHWESQDEPMHLRNICGRILHEGGQKTGRMLELYQRVLREEVPADDSREQLDLRLSGLVVKLEDKLLIYNEIYAFVFDNDWIEKSLAKLRPYAEFFNGWQDSGRLDESYLLRGQKLERASTWAEGKSLSEDDHSFLNACRNLEEKKKALRAKLQKRIILGLSVVLSLAVGFALLAVLERERAVEAEQQAIVERERAVEAKQRAIKAERVAEQAKQERTESLFDSLLTHASLLARGEDYALAKEKLAESRKLDTKISVERRHARNLLAGFTEIMGGAANKVYKGAGAALGSVVVSPNGKLLATAGEWGTLVLFDVDSGQLIKRLEGHDKTAGRYGTVRAVVFHPQGKWFASAGDDRRIILWSLPEGDKVLEWQAPDKVWALAISPDGIQLASGGTDNDITLWAVERGEKLRTFTGHSDTISSNGLVFSPNGKQLASASYDDTARLWDVKTGKSLLLKGHRDYVFNVAFSPDNKIIATSSRDKTIVLWKVDSGEPLRLLRGHQNIVVGLRFTEGRYLVSASFDRTLRFWDTDSGVTMRVLQGHKAGLTGIAIHEGQIFCASNDGTVKRRALPHQQVVDLPESAISTAIAPDGNSVVVGFSDGALRLYSLLDNRLLWEQEEVHTDIIIRLAFNAEGNLLTSASLDNMAKLWQVQEDRLQEQQAFIGHKNIVHAIAFSPDSKTLATASYDGQIGLFTVGTEKKQFIERAHEGRVGSVAFDSSGTRLLSSGEDGYMHLWNFNTHPPTLLQEFPKAQDMLMWASFSPDNKWVANVGRGPSVNIYATQDGQEQYRLVGHEQTIFRVIFSPDSQQVATVSSDATVRLWDLSNGSELFSLRLPTNSGYPVPLYDFDFRCLPNKHCWIAVPLRRGKLVLYDLGEY